MSTPTPFLGITDRFSYERAVTTATLDELGPLARHLALTLAIHLGKDGTIAAKFTPSTATLTAKLGYRPKNTHSVDEAIRQLEQAGYLLVTRSRGRRNRYQVTVPAARAGEFPGVTAPIAPACVTESTAAQGSGSAEASTAAQSSGATAAQSSGWSETTAADGSHSVPDQLLLQPSLSGEQSSTGSTGYGLDTREGEGKKLSPNPKSGTPPRPRARPGGSMTDALTPQQQQRYEEMLTFIREYFDGEDIARGREGTDLVNSIRQQLDQQARFAQMLVRLDELGHTKAIGAALRENRSPTGTGTPYAGLHNKGAEAYKRITELYATHGSGPATSVSDILKDGLGIGNQVVPLP
jgi:hypothetical protein